MIECWHCYDIWLILLFSILGVDKGSVHCQTPVVITRAVIQIETLFPLQPLHQHPALTSVLWFNQSNRPIMTSISWPTQSEHLNVLRCTEVWHEVWRGVAKSTGWMILPGPLLRCTWLTHLQLTCKKWMSLLLHVKCFGMSCSVFTWIVVKHMQLQFMINI